MIDKLLAIQKLTNKKILTIVECKRQLDEIDNQIKEIKQNIHNTAIFYGELHAQSQN